jgi:hypothetical protein
MSGHAEMRNAYKVMNRKPDGKTQVERPRRRWDDNIKANLKETVGALVLGSSCSDRGCRFYERGNKHLSTTKLGDFLDR